MLTGPVLVERNVNSGLADVERMPPAPEEIPEVLLYHHYPMSCG